MKIETLGYELVKQTLGEARLTWQFLSHGRAGRFSREVEGDTLDEAGRSIDGRLIALRIDAQNVAELKGVSKVLSLFEMLRIRAAAAR